ncbi:MAG: DUF6295 family protein [Acidimicrobiales bacterium]
MCTYQTEHIEVRASAKTPEGWTSMTNATVYFDHPVHLDAGHALMIDLLNPAIGPSTRAAFEMNPHSARALANAILKSLETIPDGLLGDLVS